MVMVGLGFIRARWENRVERLISEPWSLGERREQEGDNAAPKDPVHAADMSPKKVWPGDLESQWSSLNVTSLWNNLVQNPINILYLQNGQTMWGTWVSSGLFKPCSLEAWGSHRTPCRVPHKAGTPPLHPERLCFCLKKWALSLKILTNWKPWVQHTEHWRRVLGHRSGQRPTTTSWLCVLRQVAPSPQASVSTPGNEDDIHLIHPRRPFWGPYEINHVKTLWNYFTDRGFKKHKR